MVDPLLRPDPQVDVPKDTAVRSGRGPTAGAPRWVKVFGIIALVVIVLFVIALFGGGGSGHGPGRHASSGGIGGSTPTTEVALAFTDEGTPPEGGR